MTQLNETHDPKRRSWVESANAPDTDFPIQNLPFGVFKAGSGSARGGVALGDAIIDLSALLALGVLKGDGAKAAEAGSGSDLSPLFSLPPAAVSDLRRQLSALFSADASAAQQAELRKALVRAADAELLMPTRPPAFTDFACSIYHLRRGATMMGRPLPTAPLRIPVGYNGRPNSVAASGAPVVRPRGQFEQPMRSGNVVYAPEASLDFELEFGVWVNAGHDGVLSIPQAEQRMFGFCLVNDWSARGIQFFESALGPFLGKSFLTTISPWIVTKEAMAPFKAPLQKRDEGDDLVPAHLQDAADSASGAYSVELTAFLSTAAMRRKGTAAQEIVRTQAETLYWTFAQMLAHMASNGCPLAVGELVASGTVSGPTDDSRACFLEINQLGQNPVKLPDGEQRLWLEDGDELSIFGKARRDGYVSIGFGPCAGLIAPAG